MNRSLNPFARAAPPPTPSHPLLDRLWARYVDEVPHAKTFARLSQHFHNDHIALRTLGAPGPGLAQVARVFERLGWKHAGDYAFPDVHLRAVHLSRKGFPRIFVSELLVEKLPADARELLLRLAVDTTPAPGSFDALADWFAPPRPPPASALEVVGKASQYGAWLLAFGRKVNHFTAAVDDVEAWQLRLLQAGVPMKRDIEGKPGGALRQTATEAAVVDVKLAGGGARALPYAYFEIAERKDGFDGFLAPQARNLFDMTKPSAAITLGDPPDDDDSVVVDDVAPPYETQRRHPRKDVVVPVDASWNDGRARLIVRTSNMSLGGVFLIFDGGPVPDVGASVRLVFDLPRAGPLTAQGIVMWRMASRGAGVELEWKTPTDPTRLALAGFLQHIDRL